MPPDDVERRYSPARRRHDRARQGLRRPARLRPRPRRRDVRVGYAAAEDRLFFMDALRNAGRGQLSSFAGGANAAQDAEQWEVAPYTEADLERQTKPPPGFPAELAATIASDADNYIAGINRYITEASSTRPSCRASTRRSGARRAPSRGSAPTSSRRRRSSAASSARAAARRSPGRRSARARRPLQAAQARRRLFRDFRAAEDPEAPTTVLGAQALPLPGRRRRAARGSRAIYRRGSRQLHDVVAVEARRGELRAGAQGAARRAARLPQAPPRTRCSSPHASPRAGSRSWWPGRRSPTSTRRS